MPTRSLGQLAEEPDDDWRLYANCIGKDPDLFFPERGAAVQRNAEAKAICHRCDAQEECLEYAIHNNEKYGIWGGLTEKERRVIRKRRIALRVVA